MTYYSGVFGPHMVGASAWTKALQESKRNKPGLKWNQRMNDARNILSGKSKNTRFDKMEEKIRRIKSRATPHIRDFEDAKRNQKYLEAQRVIDDAKRRSQRSNIPDSTEIVRDVDQPEIRIVNPVVQQTEDYDYDEAKIPGDYIPSIGELELIDRQYRYCDLTRKLDECRTASRTYPDLTIGEATELKRPAQDDPLLQSIFDNPIIESKKNSLESKALELLRDYKGDKSSYLEALLKSAQKSNSQAIYKSIINTIEDENTYLGKGLYGGASNQTQIIWDTSPLLYEEFQDDWNINQAVNRMVREANPYEVEDDVEV